MLTLCTCIAYILDYYPRYSRTYKGNHMGVCAFFIPNRSRFRHLAKVHIIQVINISKIDLAESFATC